MQSSTPTDEKLQLFQASSIARTASYKKMRQLGVINPGQTKKICKFCFDRYKEDTSVEMDVDEVEGDDGDNANLWQNVRENIISLKNSLSK